MVYDDTKPTESQMESVKIILAGILGKIKNLFSELPYDKYDKKDISRFIKALQELKKELITYIKKYNNNLASKKERKKKESKKESKKEIKKETITNKPSIEYELWFRDQGNTEDDEKYYKDVLNNIIKKKLLLKKNNEKNKEWSDSDLDLYNELLDDEYLMKERIDKL